jgi:hypothetical protein
VDYITGLIGMLGGDTSARLVISPGEKKGMKAHNMGSRPGTSQCGTGGRVSLKPVFFQDFCDTLFWIFW